MGKTIVLIIGFLIYLLQAPTAFSMVTAGSSAAVVHNSNDSYSYIQSIALKKKVIAQVLKRHDSPLLSFVDSFIEACSTYELNCYLLPSISGVESTFGQFHVKGTHNPFGWGRGLIRFDSFHESIMTVGEALKAKYIDKGADSVEKIGAIYCEGNTWARKVLYFMREFEKEEQKQLYFIQDTVQL